MSTVETKGPVGRPKVDRSMKFMRSFETTIYLDSRLKAEAKNKNISVSKLIRFILEDHFEYRQP